MVVSLTANTYQTPIQIGSAIYDQAIGSGFGNTINAPSAVNAQTLSSAALMSPFGQTGFADSDYMSAANDNLNTLMTLYTNSMNTNRNAAQQADSAFGNNISEGIGVGTGLLQTMFPGTLGSKQQYNPSGGFYGNAPAGTVVPNFWSK